MPRVINMISNLQTAEVSLVRRGANNKRIALTKESTTMTFAELLKNVLGTPAEGEDELIKTLKAAGVEGDDLEASIAHYRTQNGFKDMVSKEAFAAITEAAGYEAKGKKAEEDEDEDEDLPFPGAKPPFKKKKKKAEEEEEKMKKDHSPADMSPELETIFKAQQEAIEKANDRAEQADKRAEKVEKSARHAELVVKCKEKYAHVPGKSFTEMADMLIKAEDTDPDLAKSIEDQWAATSESISKSDMLRVQGGHAINDGSAGAWGKIVAKARDMVKKSADSDLSEARAIDIVCKNEPDLYTEYMSENPAQTGRR